MYGKREVSPDFRLLTSDFRLQTLDVIFHSFYFRLHTSDLRMQRILPPQNSNKVCNAWCKALIRIREIEDNSRIVNLEMQAQ
jgi:hypothetical protein